MNTRCLAEGVALMCLAEALLRIPDSETVDKLIRDKIAAADWRSHLGIPARCSSTPRPGPDADRAPCCGPTMKASRRRAAPSRRAVERAGVAPGGDRGDAHLAVSSSWAHDRGSARPAPVTRTARYRHSFDIARRSARTMADAERYHAAYEHAIVGSAMPAAGPSRRRPAFRSSCRRCTPL